MATTDLAGKHILVTGATDGIGKATAEQLLRRGATVLAHARDAARGEPVVASLRRAHPAGQVELITGDFADLAQVRRLASEVTARHPRLDALINNAGVMLRDRRLSADGYELTFAVNYLAPFLLTNLLLPALRAAAPARVVTVSSMTHRGATLRFDDLQLSRGWEGYAAYSQSKLADLMFAYALARQLAGSGVTSNALHPGVINTKLLRGGWGGGGDDVARGAATSVFLAADPSVASVTGQYFIDSRPADSSPASHDQHAQDRLWQLAADMVGL